MTSTAQTQWTVFDRPGQRCKACGLCQWSRAVHGDGNPHARIALVGEAAGQQEEEQGRPFVGRAGEVLDGCIEEAGLTRSECWVSNAVHARPLSPLKRNRKPTAHEIDACRGWLADELRTVKPKVIVALGDVAYSTLIGKPLGGITQHHGRVVWSDEFSAWIVATFHPAYALRRYGERQWIVTELRLAKAVADNGGPQIDAPTKVEVITDLDHAFRVKQEILDAGRKFHFDFETVNGVHLTRAWGFCLSIANREGHAYVFPRFAQDCMPQWRPRDLRTLDDEVLKPLLYSDLEKGGFHVAFDDIIALNTFGRRVPRITFCGQLASHLLDGHLLPSAHSLKTCAAKETPMGRYDDALDAWLVEHGYTANGKPDLAHIWRAPDDLVRTYSGMDSDASLRLEDVYTPRLAELGLLDLFYRERLPLALEHVETDREGVRIDVSYLDKLSDQLADLLDDLEKQIGAYAAVSNGETHVKEERAVPSETPEGYERAVAEKTLTEKKRAADSETPVNEKRALRGKTPTLEKRRSKPTRLEKMRLDGVNPASAQQISLLLFELLGLPVLARTETGQPSTKEDVLKQLEPMHPIVPLILQHRAFSKIKGTYVDGRARHGKKALRAVVDPDGYARMATMVVATPTFRFATRKPFPIHTWPKTSGGKPSVRRLIIPDGGHVFVARDWDQQEFFIQSVLAGQWDVVGEMEDGADVHEIVTRELGGVSKDKYLVTLGTPGAFSGDGHFWQSEAAYHEYKKHRTKYKSMNFMILYRGGARKLARMALKCACVLVPGEKCEHVYQAEDFIAAYYERFPEIHAWQYFTIKEAKRDGYVRDPFGGVRQIQEMADPNYMTQLEGERKACNTKIQASGAHVMIRAYLELKARFRGKPPLRAPFPGRVVFTLHDQIVCQIRESLADDGDRLMRRVMEKPYPELAGRCLRTSGTITPYWAG